MRPYVRHAASASCVVMADIKKQLAERVRTERERAGLTQAQLAEAAGVTDETVSRIERGRFEPSVSTLIELSEALGSDLLAQSSPRATEGSGSPLLRRLQSRLASLDPEAQSAILQVAELLVLRRPQSQVVLKPAEPGGRHRRRKGSTK